MQESMSLIGKGGLICFPQSLVLGNTSHGGVPNMINASLFTCMQPISRFTIPDPATYRIHSDKEALVYLST